LRDIQKSHIAQTCEQSNQKISNSVHQNERTNPQHLNDDADLKKLSSVNQEVAKTDETA
jgi:hypothetical protein